MNGLRGHLRLSRPVLAALLASIAFSAVDFLSRIVVSRETASSIRLAEFAPKPPPLETTAQILERIQLWMPEETAPTTLAAVAVDDLMLRGIFVGRKGSRAILELRGADGQITRHVRAGVGDEVEGWRVGDITPKTVSIERDGFTHVLMLFRSENSSEGGG